MERVWPLGLKNDIEIIEVSLLEKMKERKKEIVRVGLHFGVGLGLSVDGVIKEKLNKDAWGGLGNGKENKHIIIIMRTLNNYNTNSKIK